jgi:hypothetical protein
LWAKAKRKKWAASLTGCDPIKGSLKVAGTNAQLTAHHLSRHGVSTFLKPLCFWAFPLYPREQQEKRMGFWVGIRVGVGWRAKADSLPWRRPSSLFTGFSNLLPFLFSTYFLI